jgi:hypothetical protein
MPNNKVILRLIPFSFPSGVFCLLSALLYVSEHVQEPSKG